jgi:hypothetical protein
MTLRGAASNFVSALMLVSLFTYCSYVAQGRLIGVDDAHIAFVYAGHLADGAGFVYNVGHERVEGFTSLLWVLICSSVFWWFTATDFPILLLSVFLVSVTYTVASLFVAHRAGATNSGWRSSLIALTYLLVIVAWPAQITWLTVSLMDTSLWALLLTATTVLILTEDVSAGRHTAIGFALLVSLMSAARPESLLLCPLFIALRFVRLLSRGKNAADASRRTVVPCTAFVLTVGGMTGFRLLYFGYPLPNTFYAKVSPSLVYNFETGFRYLYHFIGRYPLVTLIVFVNICTAAVGVVTLLTAKRKDIGHTSVALSDNLLLAVICLALLVVPALNGGDHFLWWRMYQPAYPVLLMTPFLCGADVARRAGITAMTLSLSQKLTYFVATVLFAFLFFYGTLQWREESDIANEFRIARGGMEAGRRLGELFTDNARLPSVGVVTSGGFKRTYSGVVIDLMGLNNTAMGHSPGDRKGMKNHAAFNKDVFFTLAPDVVWPFPTVPSPNARRPTRRSVGDLEEDVLRGLLEEPAFLKRYSFAVVNRRTDSARWIPAYFRIDFLLGLDPRNYQVHIIE